MTVTNKQIAKALKAAKKNLSDVTRDYICNALELVCLEQDITRVESDAARRIIRDLISPCYSVKNWLLTVANVPEEQLTTIAVQTYRHEWLDHLIKEFSE